MSGTHANLTELDARETDRLARLVTRDSMIGTGLALPAQALGGAAGVPDAGPGARDAATGAPR